MGIATDFVLGGSIYYSHGESNTRGVAILAPRNSPFKISDISKDDQGRFIVLQVDREGESIVLANIYAPTQDHPQEQIRMVNHLEEKLLGLELTNLILGGDFNVCMSASLDRSRRDAAPPAERNSGYKEKILAFSDTLHLMDVRLYLHPGVRRSTFRRGNYASRLDLWLISEHLVDSNTLAGIQTEPLSDHAAILLRLGLSDDPKGLDYGDLIIFY